MPLHRLALASALVCLAGFSPQSSHAAAVITGAYFEETKSFNCPNSLNCALFFDTLPAATEGKFLDIEEISCIVDATQGLSRAWLYVSDGGANPRRARGLDTPPKSSPLVAFNNFVIFKIAGGAPRTVSVGFTALASSLVFSGSCTVVGTISPS